MKKSKSRQHRVPSHSLKRAKRQRGFRRMEQLESRAMLAADVVSPWHNEVMPTDVNSDGTLDQQDIEILVGELKSMKQGAAAARSGLLEGEQSLYLDVDNDGKLTSRDLLTAINALTLEGEPDVAPSDVRADFDLEIVYDGITSEGGSKTVPLNSEFTLNVYVRDESPVPAGFLTALVDITFDSTKLTIDDLSSDIQLGSDFVEFPPNGDTPSLVTPYGGKYAIDNQFSEPGKLKWMGGNIATLPNVSDPGSTKLLVSITFRAIAEGPVDFSVDISPFSLNVPDDPDAEQVSFNQETRSGETVNPDENLSATFWNGGIGNDQVVRFDGGTVSIDIQDIPSNGANFDAYDVNENYQEGDNDPPVVTIGGVQYYVLDVLANDRDGAGNLVAGDRSRFNIDSFTQPTSGTVTLQTDAQNVPEIAATGITSHQVLLYQLAVDSGGVVDSFEYTTTDEGVTDNAGTTSASVVVNVADIFIDPTADSPTYQLAAGDTVTGDVTDLVALNNGTNLTFVGYDVAPNIQGEFTFDPLNPVDWAYTSDTPGLVETNVVTYNFTYEDSQGETQPLSGTLSFQTFFDGLLQGVVYFDSDNDGVVDENADIDASPELRIGGVTIQARDGSGNTYTTETDAYGSYSFVNLDEGTYSVSVIDPRFTRKGKTTAGGFALNGNEISGITIGGSDPAQVMGLNFGYRGRDLAYIGFADSLASNTEDSITLAFSKSGGTTSLEWYAVDEGWDRLVNINPAYINLDAATKSLQVAFEVSVAGLDDPAYVVQAYSPSTVGYHIVAETDEGIIIRINGSASQSMTNLAAVDAMFAGL
ncbi:SdrD B-like domain-containing protein [Blastopirellula marina]|uniref:SD-repeat containing protein B domain-containing protein n=1 Tax=Blastopirellula marina TaxID=124 RepID=A0A2S8GUP8_9BACT|nr:SdrD B-like domain-containing protein [Blastopirellula marina]PQO48158.1 hypothetical protein C5Y93_00305 [Blastopirellula marina]